MRAMRKMMDMDMPEMDMGSTTKILVAGMMVWFVNADMILHESGV